MLCFMESWPLMDTLFHPKLEFLDHPLNSELAPHGHVLHQRRLMRTLLLRELVFDLVLVSTVLQPEPISHKPA